MYAKINNYFICTSGGADTDNAHVHLQDVCPTISLYVQAGG